MMNPRMRPPALPRRLVTTLVALVVMTASGIAAADEALDEEPAEAGLEGEAPPEAPALAAVSPDARTRLEVDRPRDESNARTLRFHSFRDPLFAPSAFAAGSFAVRPGATFARVADYEDPDGPVYDLGLAGGSLDLALGIPVGRQVGFRIHGAGLVAVGTNGASLQNVGGAGVAEADGDLVLVLLRDEDGGTQLSTRFGGAARFGLLVDPSPRPGASGLPDPLTRSREWRAGGGLAVAHAFSRHVALQASVEAHGGAVTDRNDGLSETDPLLVATGAATVDLDAWPRVPVALQLGYGYEHRLRWIEPRTVQSRGAHLLGGGIFYSGNPRSVVGLTASGRLGSPADPYGRLVRVDLVFQRTF